MVELILAPICPNCHYIFEHFSITTEVEILDKNSGLYDKRLYYSNTRCPQCQKLITGIKGQEFPPKDGCFKFSLKDM